MNTHTEQDVRYRMDVGQRQAIPNSPVLNVIRPETFMVATTSLQLVFNLLHPRNRFSGFHTNTV